MFLLEKGHIKFNVNVLNRLMRREGMELNSLFFRIPLTRERQQCWSAGLSLEYADSMGSESLLHGRIQPPGRFDCMRLRVTTDTGNWQKLVTKKPNRKKKGDRNPDGRNSNLVKILSHRISSLQTSVTGRILFPYIFIFLFPVFFLNSNSV